MPAHYYWSPAIDYHYAEHDDLDVTITIHAQRADGDRADLSPADFWRAVRDSIPDDGGPVDDGASGSVLDIIRDELLDAWAIECRRSGDTTALSKRTAERWLTARDR